MTGRRVACVGGIVVGDDARLLLVRRGQEPAIGTWSVPGGRVEAGESDRTATAREVFEETGLLVEVGRLVGTVERDAPGGGVYVINDYLCRVAAGTDPAAVRGGDDATDAAWFSPEQVAALDTSPGLVDALSAWGILERSEQ
jgi:ADP-ribose pyrophosphatase YjhB (NUDIX family)